uniref:Uncharacterized protein n=1 Tax=Anguilla anguilla TaxID=7936 RepID=A0A0E9TQL7_ANGAN
MDVNLMTWDLILHVSTKATTN